jgi:hypothetical protein
MKGLLELGWSESVWFGECCEVGSKKEWGSVSYYTSVPILGSSALRTYLKLALFSYISEECLFLVNFSTWIYVI